MADAPNIEIGLNAAIVTVIDGQPSILAVHDDQGLPGLPFGPFEPTKHRTFEIGLRQFVEQQTSLHIGYVEQLYTFGDRGRHSLPGDTAPHIVSVGYLALSTPPQDDVSALEDRRAGWLPWYRHFPWEDWREGRPACLEPIIQRLKDWRKQSAATAIVDRRLVQAFGKMWLEPENPLAGFDEERVLERYELLYEAGLVDEVARDGRPTNAANEMLPDTNIYGRTMRFDHRRILATAISRLRAKLKYRPVVFDIMPETFTLTELQNTVEAIAGKKLHKQNFRRMVDASALVEPTGSTEARTGGRPAALYRFRRAALEANATPGLRFGGRT